MTYSLTVLVVYLGLDIIGFYRAFLKMISASCFARPLHFLIYNSPQVCLALSHFELEEWRRSLEIVAR
jgi:hypothetical protein